MKKKKIQPKTSEEFLGEIRMLLIYALYKSDVSTKEIGKVLGYSYKTIENMLPKKIKREGFGSKK